MQWMHIGRINVPFNFCEGGGEDGVFEKARFQFGEKVSLKELQSKDCIGNQAAASTQSSSCHEGSCWILGFCNIDGLVFGKRGLCKLV